jgi:hypothetical protein
MTISLHREPSVPRTNEIRRVTQDVLASRLTQLPEGETTRISVARYRGAYAHGDHDYLRVNELGGFHAAGPVAIDDIVSATEVAPSASPPTASTLLGYAGRCSSTG